jgi:hypothetical protein
MKISRFRHEYRQSASKLHKAVGDILRADFLGVQEIYQEYPVSRVNEKYSDNRHHFDWVIPRLNIVIECHGKQHYTPVAFGGDVEKSITAFQEQKKRDNAKKNAALQAGYIYVEVPYHLEKKLSEDKLLELIELGKDLLKQYNIDHKEEIEEEARNESIQLAEELKEKKRVAAKEARQRYLASNQHRKELLQAKASRQERYRRAKEFKKNGPR